MATQITMWTMEAYDQTTGESEIPTRTLFGPATLLYLSEFDSFQPGFLDSVYAWINLVVIIFCHFNNNLYCSAMMIRAEWNSTSSQHSEQRPLRM
jgi:hypothetical protein